MAARIRHLERDRVDPVERVQEAAEGSLRIENYSKRPVDSPVHSTITNAHLEKVTIEGCNYDIDSTFVRNGDLVLEGGSHLRASTTDHTNVTIIACDGTLGGYEAMFMSSNQAMRVMGVGGDIRFHGCEFNYLAALEINSLATGITIEESSFQFVTVTSGARADSIDARNNYWHSASGPGRAVTVSGPIRTVPFRTSAATIGYRPQ